MKKLLVVVSIVAFASAAAAAQSLSTSIRGSAAHAGPVPAHSLSVPAACSPCLWYAGDFDPNNGSSNAWFNGNSEWLGASAQVWVPFTPTSDGNPTHKHVDVSSITFNELVVNSYANEFPSDLDGMTYQFNTDVTSGIAGTQGKPASCHSVSIVATGNTFYGETEYSFTCILKTAKKLAVGTNYWVNLLPTFTTESRAFLSDVEDLPAPNQTGWGDIYYNSFFNSAFFYADFEPLWSAGLGDETGLFSVAIAGTNVD